MLGIYAKTIMIATRTEQAYPSEKQAKTPSTKRQPPKMSWLIVLVKACKRGAQIMAHRLAVSPFSASVQGHPRPCVTGNLQPKSRTASAHQ